MIQYDGQAGLHTQWTTTTQQRIEIRKRNISEGTNSSLFERTEAKDKTLNGILTVEINEPNVYLTTNDLVYALGYIYNSTYSGTNFPLDESSFLGLTRADSGGYSSSNETWGVFDGTESGVANGQAFTIQGGNNIQSITRVGTGIYEVNMINPKPNEFYHVSVGVNPLGFGGADGGATDEGPSTTSSVAYEPTASKFRLDIRDNANNQKDSNRISFHVVC